MTAYPHFNLALEECLVHLPYQKAAFGDALGGQDLSSYGRVIYD